MSLIDKRTPYKPFEYPEILIYTEAIQKGYWVHTEVDFTADIQDYNTALDEVKKEIHKRSIISIAQVEVTVKGFWGDLYHYFPKPEINGLGATFAENEFRHSEAYSRILDVNGYTTAFEEELQNPVFRDYNNMVVNIMKDGNKTIFEKLLFFVLVIENTSLFSKFANILAFTHFDGLMKNTANMIAWTSVDEDVHANAGIYLINKMRKEGLISESINQKWIEDACRAFIYQEDKMLDWIFEKGELPYYSKNQLLSYMKVRLNEALGKIGFEPVFNTTEKDREPFKWFEEEIYANSMDDFFAKRPVDYTKHDKPVTADDLF